MIRISKSFFVSLVSCWLIVEATLGMQIPSRESVEVEDSEECPEFQCGSGECIPLRWRCNEIWDCGDRSDEIACDFCHCAREHQKDCIHTFWWCDGEEQCPNGADEHDCTMINPKPTKSSSGTTEIPTNSTGTSEKSSPSDPIIVSTDRTISTDDESSESLSNLVAFTTQSISLVHSSEPPETSIISNENSNNQLISSETFQQEPFSEETTKNPEIFTSGISEQNSEKPDETFESSENSIYIDLIETLETTESLKETSETTVSSEETTEVTDETSETTEISLEILDPAPISDATLETYVIPGEAFSATVAIPDQTSETAAIPDETSETAAIPDETSETAATPEETLVLSTTTSEILIDASEEQIIPTETSEKSEISVISEQTLPEEAPVESFEIPAKSMASSVSPVKSPELVINSVTSPEPSTDLASSSEFPHNSIILSSNPLSSVYSPECLDYHQYCDYWSSAGFCSTHSSYMVRNCKKSCLLCGNSTTVSPGPDTDGQEPPSSNDPFKHSSFEENFGAE